MAQHSNETTDDQRGTVLVQLRFWRNRSPSGKGRHHQTGAYLPAGHVWPAGTVYVPKQRHAPKTGNRKFNHPFELMAAIRNALKDAGVTIED